MNDPFILNRMELKRTILLSNSLTVFRHLNQDEVILSFNSLLESLTTPESNAEDIFLNYHRFCTLAIENKWPEYLLDFVIKDDNSFSMESAQKGIDRLNPLLKKMAARDLDILQEMGSIGAQDLLNLIADLFNKQFVSTPNNDFLWGHVLLAVEDWPTWDKIPMIKEEVSEADWISFKQSGVKEAFRKSKLWSEAINELVSYYYGVGSGLFSHYLAFRWQGEPQARGLLGISHSDPIHLEQLIGLENELAAITENTEYFLKGLPAQNILIYGNRGTGKSSAVKALLFKYADRGLRLVELVKNELHDFPNLVRLLASRPQKFIIFIDDLSFEDSETEYKYLKTLLEGGLEIKPQNILVYATSNRRHLIKETFSERQGDEVHVRDNMEEKLSLADRFGLTVTFPSTDQEGYLKIVEGLAKQNNLRIEQGELRQLALRWEMWHNGRSGRTARQFIDHLRAGR